MSAPTQDPLALDIGAGGGPAYTEGAGTTTGGLLIVAYGNPVKQGDLTRSQHGVLYHSNRKALLPWRDTVAAAAREAIAAAYPDAGVPLYGRGVPVRVGVVWTFDRSGAHFGSGRNADTLKPSAPSEHVHAPDLDKLLRAVFDALSGPVWHDDRQVARLTDTARVYPGQHRDALRIPGVVIRVTELPR